MRRTGKYAYVNGIPCTQGWSLNGNSSIQAYLASCVPGASGAVPGNTDWSGSMKGLGAVPPLPTGENLTFLGVASNKSGEIVHYNATIMISDTTLTIPVAAGTPISWTANFGVQGEPLPITRVPPPVEDPTRDTPPSGKWGKVKIERVLDSDTFDEVARPQTITVTWRRTLANTITDGTTERESGNLEATLNFAVHNDDLERHDATEPQSLSLYPLNGINRVQVFIGPDPTDCYLFDSIIWQSLTNFNVDRSANPPPIIGYTVNGLWTATREDRVPADLGEILYPDGSELYPGSLTL